jgi:hypothetical protein
MNLDILKTLTKEDILNWGGNLEWLARIVVDKPWEHDTFLVHDDFDHHCSKCFKKMYEPGVPQNLYTDDYHRPCAEPPPLASIYPNLSNKNILRIVAWELREKVNNDEELDALDSIIEVENYVNKIKTCETCGHSKTKGSMSWFMEAQPIHWIKAALLSMKEMEE